MNYNQISKLVEHYNKSRIELPPINFTYLTSQEIQEIDNKNQNIISKAVEKDGYNGFKINLEHLMKIVNSEDGLLGRKNGDAHGFDFSYEDLSYDLFSENLNDDYTKSDECSSYLNEDNTNQIESYLSNDDCYFKISKANYKDANLTRVIIDGYIVKEIVDNNSSTTILNKTKCDLSNLKIYALNFENEDINALEKANLENISISCLKLNIEHVKKILNLNKYETFLGRTRGDLHNFWLSGLDFREIEIEKLENANFVNTSLINVKLNTEQVNKILYLQDDETFLGRTRGNLKYFDLSYADYTENIARRHENVRFIHNINSNVRKTGITPLVRYNGKTYCGSNIISGNFLAPIIIYKNTQMAALDRFNNNLEMANHEIVYDSNEDISESLSESDEELNKRLSPYGEYPEKKRKFK